MRPAQNPPPRWRRPAGLSWPVVLFLLALAAGVVLFWWNLKERARQAEVVAQVGTEEITRAQLADSLRALLWTRGLAWPGLLPEQRQQFRAEALQALTDRLALESWQTRHGGNQVSPTATEEALQNFIKQFEEPGSWQERAALQHFSEAGLQHWISVETGLRESVETIAAQAAAGVTDEDVKKWFEAYASRVEVPERVRASHIFLTRHDPKRPDRSTEMEEHHRRLTSGETTFAELATKVSEDDRSKKNGGRLGWFARDRVPEDFAKSVFAQTPGTLGTPFVTQLGWHLVLVHEKRPGRSARLAEVQEEIAAWLRTQKRAAAVAEFARTVREDAPVAVFPERLSTVEPSP